MNRFISLLLICFLSVSFIGCNKKHDQVIVNSTIVQPPIITVTSNENERDTIILGAHCTEVLMYLRLPTTQSLTGRQIFKKISDIVNTKRFNDEVRIFMNNSGLDFNDNPIGSERLQKLIDIFVQIQVEADKFSGVKLK